LTVSTGDLAATNDSAATQSMIASALRTDTDISSAINALRNAVLAYNGYDINSSADINEATKENTGAAKDFSVTGTPSSLTTSALAAFNALDDGAYSVFGTDSGFGSDQGSVQASELGAGSGYYSLAGTAASDTAQSTAYAKAGTGVVAGGADAGLSAIGDSAVVSGRVMAMAAYASELNRSTLLTGSSVGLAGSNDMTKTADGTDAVTITANKDGIGGQIAGFNISVSDSEGNVKKSVNASLDSWTETVRAQNKSADNAISLHVGAAANQAIKVGLTDMRSEALGLKGADGTKLNISTQTKANAAINVLDNALQKALDQQTTIGSVESRLEYTSSNLTTSSENVQASESTIRDADMAKEMTEYTKNNVLLQAAQSMLAQANQNSSAVLSLLQ
jgi:flagellin-like hook-associated protein FlgL